MGDAAQWARAVRAYAGGASAEDAARSSARPGAGDLEITRLAEHVRAVAAGVGPEIAALLTDTRITDVLVNSTEVWVDRGSGLEREDLPLGGERAVRSLAVHMAAACGRRLDDASPVVDGTLPGGVRLHAVLPPLAPDGTLISLRVHRATTLSVDDLRAGATLCAQAHAFIHEAVAARLNVLVSGATGSGKTTLLAAALALVPDSERIVCIEEVTELRPAHPHVVHLQERRANVQGVGAVTLTDLVRAAMRMRPDRLVLGECRGAEVREVLTALNTGHEGGWATIHANTAADVPARLVALGALAGMDARTVAAQAVSAFDAVVHVRRAAAGDGTRRWVSEIAALDVRDGHLLCVPALTVAADGSAEVGVGARMLRSGLWALGRRGGGVA